MLNRRMLRVKAMQQLYALTHCRESNYHLAIEEIKDHFSPDLNSMEPQDPVLLKKKGRVGTDLFEKNVDSESLDMGDVEDDEIQKVVRQAILSYHQQNEKDYQNLLKRLVPESEKIIDRYYRVIALLLAFREIAEEQARKLKTTPTKSTLPLIGIDHFPKNSILKALEDYVPLEAEVLKRGLKWDNDKALVRHWFKDTVLKDPKFIDYSSKATVSNEEDLEILNHILKNIVIKGDVVGKFLEEEDLMWLEDRDIVRSMVKKTLKSALPSEDDQIQLAEISNNWDQDKAFYKDLFKFTVESESSYETLIAQKAKNWKLDRIAVTDLIIIKLALAEFEYFPSIPVKVTINEFIEISKNYSTPKSKQFVNGILDVLSVDMIQSGAIKKSGRGLIDNK